MKRSLILALVMSLASIGIYAIPPGTDAEIEQRLTPFGSVCREGDDCGTAVAAAASGALSGEEVYNQYCTVCHASGVSNAPIRGDAGQWQPRIDKGMDELMASTLNGLNAMPAKGTCMSCSDEELAATVDYMLEQLP